LGSFGEALKKKTEALVFELGTSDFHVKPMNFLVYFHQASTIGKTPGKVGK